MRLYQKLVLFMLAATVLPLAAVGFWLLRGAEVELSRRIGNEQRAQARAAAELAEAQLAQVIDPLQRATAPLDWRNLQPDELKGALSLLYQQLPTVSAVLLLDGNGALLEGPVYSAEGSPEHPGFSAATGREALVRAFPSGLVGLLKDKGDVGMSAAYLHSLGKMAAVAVAIRLEQGERSPVALAEVGLGTLARRLKERATADVGRIDLVDREGRVVASSEDGPLLAPLEASLLASAREHLKAEEATRFTLDSGERLLVSAARVPSLELLAVVRLPERVALAPVRAMRRTVLVSMGGALLVLLGLGALFTRGLNARLSLLVKGAEAFGRGELSSRVPVEGADELSELAETFNRMGGELQGARARLERWNDDLRAEVERATAELREAQVQLLEAQKLAAVGQLGAGVAHEINNPLAGILGNTQLLLLDRGESDQDFGTLKQIEQSAKRCKEITQNLLRFSQQQQHRASLRPLDVNALVRDAVAQTEGPAKGEGIAVEGQLHPSPLQVRGDAALLAQTLQALIANARTAMLKSPEKRLSLSTREDGDAVLVEVRDTGKGIKPEHLSRLFEPFFTTKDVWSNVGLGLAVAYRVMNEHKGRIDVSTEVGKGSAFTLRLPKLDSQQVPGESIPAKPAQGSGSLLI